jgi:hypothetical protein
VGSLKSMSKISNPLCAGAGLVTGAVLVWGLLEPPRRSPPSPRRSSPPRRPTFVSGLANGMMVGAVGLNGAGFFDGEIPNRVFPVFAFGVGLVLGAGLGPVAGLAVVVGPKGYAVVFG